MTGLYAASARGRAAAIGSILPDDAAAAGDVLANAGGAAAAKGAPADDAHDTPLLVLYGSNMGKASGVLTGVRQLMGFWRGGGSQLCMGSTAD